MNASKRKDALKILALGGCTLAIAAGGTLAYLTATDSVTNEFTVAQGLQDKVRVVEENWDPESGQGILPAQTVSKDPALLNESPVDVYAVVKVSVPFGKGIAIAQQNGDILPASSRELFSYQLNSSWSELGEGVLSDAEDEITHTYLYANPLPSGEKSTPVFDEVTLINAIDGQIEGRNLTITVDGFAIQAEGFASPEDAWNAYLRQNEQA